METFRRETSDGQTSDVRLAVWLAVYTPLGACCMAVGDFSTTLEMTGERYI